MPRWDDAAPSAASVASAKRSEATGRCIEYTGRRKRSEATGRCIEYTGRRGSNRSAAVTWPFLHAMCSAVRPEVAAWLTSAAARSTSRKHDSRPFSAAVCHGQGRVCFEMRAFGRVC
eukprot:4269090-Prymnesium_polylepis.1